MSKFRIAIAFVVLASLSASPALARGFGLGGLLGGVRSVVSRVLPLGIHRGHRSAREGHIHDGHDGHDGHVQTAALEPQGMPDAALGSPSARGQIVAAAALAGWHEGRASSGWWRHDDGSYGWVGPLFWPFAFDDIYDYGVFGDGAGIWGYGYKDIYAGIFAPYGQEDLASYRLDNASGRKQRRSVSLQELCGEAVDEIAGRTVQQIQQAIQQSNDEQRAALGELATASSQAAYIIRASCPAQAPLTAPDRLNVMQDRVEAMITATSLLRAPFAKLYDLLDDEQKARLNERAASRKTSGAGCEAEPTPGLQWPVSEIEAGLHPDHRQHVALEVLQNTSARAMDILNRACQPADVPTPSARFSAANRRLIAMLQAVRQVKAALEDCLATLGDGQKAKLEAIGPRRTSS